MGPREEVGTFCVTDDQGTIECGQEAGRSMTQKPMGTSIGIVCADAREAMSASLDGEALGITQTALDDHVARCGPCGLWRAQTADMAPSMRLRSVAVPDLTESVLNAIARDPHVSVGAALVRGKCQILRAGLAISAIAQILLVLPQLFASADTPGARVGWEMASFEIAVAAGYVYAAWRPNRAANFLPVAATLAACLVLVGVRDVYENPTMLAYNLGHLLVVVQVGLLWGLTRIVPVALRRPGTRDSAVEMVPDRVGA